MENHEFWAALETLVKQSSIIIDRPKNSSHPKYLAMIYPADYGYLADTTSMDGGGIDIYRGISSSTEITGILCIVDLMKKDSEIKILLGCSKKEREEIYAFHNKTAYMKAVLIDR